MNALLLIFILWAVPSIQSTIALIIIYMYWALWYSILWMLLCYYNVCYPCFCSIQLYLHDCGSFFPLLYFTLPLFILIIMRFLSWFYLHYTLIIPIAICPTCGQFLVTLAKVYQLSQRVAQLQRSMDAVTNNSTSPTQGTNECESKVRRSCLIDQTTQADKTFVRNRAGLICFCDVS